ncbi:MAG: hypothetical protein ABFR62_05855 [Bacteroidota bacterium]
MFTLTIDDNPIYDPEFWKSMQLKYGFNFTWFVITEAENNTYNVNDWPAFIELESLGN